MGLASERPRKQTHARVMTDNNLCHCSRSFRHLHRRLGANRDLLFVARYRLLA